jgi:peptidoglycan hydrolase-like protein with peptidoglycan-binding domain
LRKALALLTLALLVPAGLMLAAAAAKKKAATRKAPAKTAASTATKKGAAKKSSKSSNRRRAKKRPAQGTWRTRQLAPTPERYQEIQQALIKKGYLQGTGTGRWDEDSIAALRRFQQEQHLEPSGKIDSLSLIALGLGPKYDAATAGPPPPKPPQ